MEKIAAMPDDVCQTMHCAGEDIVRFDVTVCVQREELAPTIRRARSLANGWDLDVFVGIDGRQLKVTFVRRIVRKRRRPRRLFGGVEKGRDE
jgi:hypothetical protein